jgi:glycine/sarcosine N-methyltransferase
MSQFYQSIADYYDDIFPLSDALRGFLLTFGITKEDDVLDIGCATGEVALFLSQCSKSITGIDLDPDLIAIAQTKQRQQGSDNTQFQIGDMEELGSMFSPGQFRFAFCLGNTLVHLDTPEKIDAFLREVANILCEKGTFVFQILNYGKILARGIDTLPLIDNERITFKRGYDHRTHFPRLVFNTRLTIKTASAVIDNSIDLYPITRAGLAGLPGQKLYRSCRFLGGFDKREFRVDDDLLIGVWQK